MALELRRRRCVVRTAAEALKLRPKIQLPLVGPWQDGSPSTPHLMPLTRPVAGPRSKPSKTPQPRAQANQSRCGVPLGHGILSAPVFQHGQQHLCSVPAVRKQFPGGKPRSEKDDNEGPTRTRRTLEERLNLSDSCQRPPGALHKARHTSKAATPHSPVLAASYAKTTFSAVPAASLRLASRTNCCSLSPPPRPNACKDASSILGCCPRTTTS